MGGMAAGSDRWDRDVSICASNIFESLWDVGEGFWVQAHNQHVNAKIKTSCIGFKMSV